MAGRFVIEREDIAAIVQSSLQEINRERPPDDQIPISEGIPLLSEDSPLDSVQFVAFVTHLESELHRLAGRDIELVASALAEESDPFETVRSLTDYIAALIGRER